MIQNKPIHYWKLGRDELLLARRNPEIQEIKDHQKETNKRGVDAARMVVQTTVATLTTTNIYYFYFIILTSQMCK